jgi:tetratricopeptide (TPR) repeat protein
MDVPIFAASSSAEEWAETGRRLFEHKRFLQARHCFERANQPQNVTIANAYYLREKARIISGNSETDHLARKQAFHAAAREFVDCASNAKHNVSRSYYKVAAACFQSAEEFQRAAQCYERAEDFNNASQLYRKLGYFDDITRIIQAHQNSMDESLVNSLTGIAKLFYLRQNQIQ